MRNLILTLSALLLVSTPAWADNTSFANAQNLVPGQPPVAHYAELDAVKAFGDKFIMKQMGRGFVKVGGAETDPEDIRMVEEAWEEAGIPDAVATQAKPAGVLHICRAQPDGLQRETIFVHDLWLDADFVPVCQDGEVVEHRLLTMVQSASVATNSVGCDVVTADASLVIVDCLIRHGVIAMDLRDYAALSKLRHPTLELTPP